MSQTHTVRCSSLLTPENKSGQDPQVVVPVIGDWENWPRVTVKPGDVVANLQIDQTESYFPDIVATLYEVAPNGEMFISPTQPKPGDILVTTMDISEQNQLGGNAGVITNTGKLVPIGFGFIMFQAPMFENYIPDQPSE